MNTSFNPKLALLFKDLNNISIENFLVSTSFNRILIKHNYLEDWEIALIEIHKSKPLNISLLSVMSSNSNNQQRAIDYLLSFKWLLNAFYVRNHINHFNILLIETLCEFVSWRKGEVNLNEIIKDIDLLEIDKNLINKFQSVYTPNNTNNLQKNLNQQNFVDLKRNWIKSISKAEIEKVVDEIIEYGVENENDIIALSSRWHSLKTKYNKGIMKEDDFNIENNKIVNSLLDFIKNLKDTEGS